MSYKWKGAENFIHPVSSGDLQSAQQYAGEPGQPGSYEFLSAANILMQENHMQMPTTVQEALAFYLNLKALFEVEMY